MIDYTYKDLYYEDSVDKQLKIEVEDGTVITNEDIFSESMTLTESLCSETSLTFGSCEASKLEIKIANQFYSMKDQWLTISEVLNGHEDDPFVIGKYRVDSDRPTADRTFRQIVAYDAMYDIINADQEDVANWYNDLLPEDDSTVTMKEFRDSFLNHFGLEAVEKSLPNDDMIVEKTLSATSLSGKTVITAICELNGCFGHINRNNKFDFVTLSVLGNDEDTAELGKMILGKAVLGSVPTNELDPSQYITSDYEDYVCEKIDRLKIAAEDGDIGAEVGTDEGDNYYIVSGNFLVYGKGTKDLTQIANNLYSAISAVSYRPAEVDSRGNPCVEVGDGIVLYTKYQEIQTYVLQRTLKGIQALRDTYTSQGTEKYPDSSTSLETSVEQLKGKTNSLTRTVEETRSEIADVETSLSTEIVQTAEGLTILVENTAQDLTNMITMTAEGLTAQVDAVESQMTYINEKAITGTQVEYYKSSSPYELEDGEWTTETPEWEEGYYIWERTIITTGIEGEETTFTTEPVCLTGNTGADGDEGVGIIDIVAYYAISTSPDYYPTHGGNTTSVLGTMVLGRSVLGNSGVWTPEMPDVGDDEYLWLSFYITYTDGREDWTTPVCLTDASVRLQLNRTVEQMATIQVGLDSINQQVTSLETNIYTNYSTTEEITAQILLQADETSTSILARVSDTYATIENVTYIGDLVYQLQEEAVASIETYYAVSDSNEDPGEVTWQTDIPEVGEGQYLWVRYLVTYINDSTEWTDPFCVTSDTDLAVQTIVPYYSVSESHEWCQPHDTENAAIVDSAIVDSAILGKDGAWTTEQPEITEYEYLWVSYLVTTIGGDQTWTEPTCITDKTTKEAYESLQQAYSEILLELNSISLNIVGGLGGIASIEMKVGDEAITADVDLSDVREAFANEDSSIQISAGTIAFVSNTLIVDSNNFTLTAQGQVTATDINVNNNYRLLLNGSNTETIITAIEYDSGYMDYLIGYPNKNTGIRFYYYQSRAQIVFTGGNDVSSQVNISSYISEFVNNAPYFANSTNSEMYFYERSGTYYRTTSTSANVALCALENGLGTATSQYFSRLARSTSSSIRYKNSVQTLSSGDTDKLFDIPVYWFKYNDEYLSPDDERYEKLIPGFIVEDWQETFPIAVDHDYKGNPEMWNEKIVVPLIFEMVKYNHSTIVDNQNDIKELQNRLEQAETEITELKSQIDKLTA